MTMTNDPMATLIELQKSSSEMGETAGRTAISEISLELLVW